MKKIYSNTILLLLVLILVSSCIKPKLEPDSLKGKWEYSRYEVVTHSKNQGVNDTINSRETIEETGFIEFLNSDLNGLKQLNGTLRFPSNSGLLDSDFTLGEFQVQNTKYNSRNQYTGTVKNSIGNVLYDFMTIKLISKKKMLIQIGRKDEINPNETASKLIYIQLKKS